MSAFGAAGVTVSLFDFFVVRGHSIFEIDLVGVVVFLAGVTVTASARRALGKFFSTRVRVTSAQRLIQSGPYRYIRHPIYLGVILLYFSAPIAYQSTYGALVALPVVPILLHRISIEEKAMTLHFGSEYEAYAKRTKRLVPLIY